MRIRASTVGKNADVQSSSEEEEEKKVENIIKSHQTSAINAFTNLNKFNDGNLQESVYPEEDVHDPRKESTVSV